MGFRHLDGAGSRVPTGGGGGVETAAAAASSEGGVTGEGSSKVRGRGEGEAWGRARGPPTHDLACALQLLPRVCTCRRRLALVLLHADGTPRQDGQRE